MKRILCFAPHPDDEIFGCGGSLVKALSLGHEVFLCYLSLGEYGSPSIKPELLAQVRKKESLDVARFLAIPQPNITFLGIPDGTIDSMNLEDMKMIMALVRKIKPDLAYLPHKNEHSSDHFETYKLVMRALDMAGSNNFIEYGKEAWWVENVLAYEVWTPMERYQYSEDISEFIDKKIGALSLYKSQANESGNVSDFIGEKARYLAGYRAAMTLGDYREMFRVVRMESFYDRP